MPENGKWDLTWRVKGYKPFAVTAAMTLFYSLYTKVLFYIKIFHFPDGCFV
jgi:hypothetical protein